MKKTLFITLGALCIAGIAIWFLTAGQGKAETGQAESGPKTRIEVAVASCSEAESDRIMQNTADVLQKRLEMHGIRKPEVEITGADKLTVSIPPQEDMDAVRRLLCTKGRLELRTTFFFAEVADRLMQAMDANPSDSISAILDIVSFRSPCMALADAEDTEKVNAWLSKPEVRGILGKNLRPIWTIGPVYEAVEKLGLIAVHEDKQSMLNHEDIADARAHHSIYSDEVEVRISMTEEGKEKWARMTGDNIGRCIAIVIDDLVYSYPNVANQITIGKCSITSGFTMDEAEELACIINSGPLPASVQIQREWTE